MNQDKWTQQLHDKLADYETPAPVDLWADIEAALPAQPRRSRFVVLRRWAVAASVVALLGGGALVWWGLQHQPSEEWASMAEEEYYGGEGEAAPVEVVPLQEKRVEWRRKVERVKAPSSLPADHADRPVEQKETEVADEKTVAETAPAQEVDKPVTETTSVPRPLHRSSHRSKRQLTLGLYAMNGFGSQNNSNAVQMADALAQNYANTYAAGQAASRQAPIYLVGYEEQQHHYQPIAFGLTLSYPLNDRLFLTSGVVYTRLKSDFTQVIHSQQINTDQMLHYVGIPLSMNYRLWQYKGLNVYLSAGMQADWNVKAQVNTEGVEQEMGLDRLQWSVNGSLGLQYNVLPQLSLYAEPGINHYFDNGSTLQNYFKDKPTSLKLQVGVRVNLQ